MGVYSTSGSTVLENDNNIIECTYNSPIEAAFNFVAEGEANYNKIMQAVGVDELSVLESTGVEMVYEAADIKGLFGKIKEFFINLWNKIKGLFQKFMALINSYAKSDKDFVNKYKKTLSLVDTKGFEYKGYKFTNLDHDITDSVYKAEKAVQDEAGSTFAFGSDAGKAEAWTKALDDKSDILEKARGAAINATPIESGDFAKELHTFFRDGQDTKQTIENVSVSELLGIIDGAAETKKHAEKAYKDVDKAFKDFIKQTETVEKELVKQVPTGTDDGNATVATLIRGGSAAMQFSKDIASIITLVNGALLTAIKDHNRQAKTVCVQLIGYKPKNESGFVHTEGTSFLNSVVFK